jgi:hypothetical protein
MSKQGLHEYMTKFTTATALTKESPGMEGNISVLSFLFDGLDIILGTKAC